MDYCEIKVVFFYIKIIWFVKYYNSRIVKGKNNFNVMDYI